MRIMVRESYNLLRGTLVPGVGIQKVSRELPRYLASLKRSTAFKKLHRQVDGYRIFCETQWRENYGQSSRIIKELTGIVLRRKSIVYLTHPSLRNGRNFGKGVIAWGHHEEWPNYTTTYLWHEILHSYFPSNEKTHALIQLIADNELRARLNGTQYPPFKGHRDLFPLMKRMLLQWRRYLKKGGGNITKFPLQRL